MSYSWYRKGTCSVINGDARVNFQNADITTAPNKPVVGDAFVVNFSDIYEVIFIGNDGVGEYIMLDRNYDQATAQNTHYAFMRLASSNQNAKLVAQASAAINQKQISLEDMHEWYTLQQDEVDFTQPDGTTIKIPTWYKFNNDLGTVGSNLPAIETAADNIDAIKAAPTAAQTATDKAAEAAADAQKAEAAAAKLTWTQYCRTESEMIQMIRDNLNKFAANGYVTEVEDFVFGSTPNSFTLKKCQLHMDGFIVTVPTQIFKLPEASDDPLLANRVDKYGFKFKLETINDLDPYVYPSGNTKDVAGRVNFQTATDQVKASLVIGSGENENNIWLMRDGTVKQLRVYQYVEAGTVNGDWNISGLRFDKTKGDVTTELLYVMGSCLRLNKGAQHPRYNDLGTRNWNTTGANRGSKWFDSAVIQPSNDDDAFSVVDGSSTTDVGAVSLSGYIGSSQSGRDDGRFYDKIEKEGKGGLLDDRLSARDKSSPGEASNIVHNVKSSAYRGKEKLVKTFVFETAISRSAASSYGRLGMSIADVDSIRAALGMPTGASTQNLADYNIGAFAYFPSNGRIVNIHSLGHGGVASNSRLLVYLDPENQKLGYFTTNRSVLLGNVLGVPVLSSSGNTSTANTAELGNSGDTFYIIATKQTSIPIDGEFECSDVIGDPALLIQTKELSQGWYGYWIPVIPDGSSTKVFPLSRKALSSTNMVTYTDTNGSTWANAVSASIDTTRNALSLNNQQATRVRIDKYPASAYVTEFSDPKNVLNADSGLLDVFITESHKKEDGVLLAESCVNEVLKSDANGIVKESAGAIKHLIDGELKRVKTQLSDLVTPTNSSKAIKIAVYQVLIDQKLYLGFLANTMEHNGTSWGEIEEMQIPTGKGSTFPDANSNIQLATWSVSTKPYGYFKKPISSASAVMMASYYSAMPAPTV